MSGLEEKLAPVQRTHGDRPRATRKKLEERRNTGPAYFGKDGNEFWIRSMGRTEVWVLVSGRGAEAIYEQIPGGGDSGPSEAG